MVIAHFAFLLVASLFVLIHRAWAAALAAALLSSGVAFSHLLSAILRAWSSRCFFVAFFHRFSTKAVPAFDALLFLGIAPDSITYACLRITQKCSGELWRRS